MRASSHFMALWTEYDLRCVTLLEKCKLKCVLKTIGLKEQTENHWYVI